MRPTPTRLVALAPLLLVQFVVAGCSWLPAVTQPALDGTIWRAIEIDGGPPLAGTEPEIRFEEGQLGGTAGCNQFGGAFTLDAGGFRMGEMRTTLMACEPDVGRQESAFITALGGAASLTVLGDRLTIDGPAGRLVFEPAPTR